MGGCCSKKPVVVPVRQPSPTPIPTRSPTPRLITPKSTIKAPSTRAPSAFTEYCPEPAFSHIGINTRNPLRLIEGYKNEPLVSLEEALVPFYGAIDGLDDYVREAKMKCHYPSEQGLTHDESAAIYIYTMKWGEDCLHNELQAAWKREDPEEMKYWLKYLKLFKTAYDKLPDAKGEVWQGTSFDQTLKDQLTKTPLTMYSAMGSCSSSKQIVERFLQERGDSEKMIVGFKAIGGKMLGPYSAVDSTDIAVWPGTKVGLADMEIITETGSIVFHLTGKIKPESAKKPVILEKHFVCCNDRCDNRCNQKHDPNHCHGFNALFHTCGHHCGPTHTCFRCGQNIDSVYQCKICERRWCKNCFNKYAMIPQLPNKANFA